MCTCIAMYLRCIGARTLDTCYAYITVTHHDTPDDTITNVIESTRVSCRLLSESVSPNEISILPVPRAGCMTQLGKTRACRGGGFQSVKSGELATTPLAVFPAAPCWRMAVFPYKKYWGGRHLAFLDLAGMSTAADVPTTGGAPCQPNRPHWQRLCRATCPTNTTAALPFSFC